MFQMGGIGPMLGQVHHFSRFNPGKAPYAQERYGRRPGGFISVMDERTATKRISRGQRTDDRRHCDMAMDFRASSGRRST
ncbi:MAG: hypothetical protein R3D03_01565 [Geminicoccaceae bacterium]